MNKRTSQLLLPLRAQEAVSFASFRGEENALLIQALYAALRNEGERQVFCWSAEASVGRTHLLLATAHAAEVLGVRAAYLPFSELIKESPDSLEDLSQMQVLCFDDLNYLEASPVWQEAIFHLYNAAKEKESCMIFSASKVPSKLNILPDLQSRFSWGLTFEVKSLSDAGKLWVLEDHAKRRGLAFPREVAEFLIHRVSRSMDDLLKTLSKLDEASLALQRKLTIPFVKETLRI